MFTEDYDKLGNARVLTRSFDGGAFYTDTFTRNADGSYTVVYQPSMGSPITYNQSLAKQDGYDVVTRKFTNPNSTDVFVIAQGSPAASVQSQMAPPDNNPNLVGRVTVSADGTQTKTGSVDASRYLP